MKGSKIAVVGISIVLVVGVFIGLIAGITRSGGSSSSSNNNLSTSAKAIAAICAPTDYKEACTNSLSSVANNATATPKDLIQLAINVTVEEVKAALLKSQTIGKAANDSRDKMAFEDCKDLLEFAVDELEASFSMVGDSDMHSLSDREADLKNWLSAVISYQETCLDGVTKPELKSAMSNGLVNATQLTVNALAMVSEISGILNTLNIPLNISAASRRLLDESDVDNGGYPAWFSAADRKLLANQGSGQLKPNAVVAKDGTGQYKTIGAALAAYPKNLKGRYVIYVKAGIYNEYLTVTKDMVNVFMYGDGPRKTMITGKKCNRDGVSTYQSASFCELTFRLLNDFHLSL